jgi:hypothetical protein
LLLDFATKKFWEKRFHESLYCFCCLFLNGIVVRSRVRILGKSWQLEKSSTYSHTLLGLDPQIGRPLSRIVVPLVCFFLFPLFFAQYSSFKSTFLQFSRWFCTLTLWDLAIRFSYQFGLYFAASQRILFFWTKFSVHHKILFFSWISFFCKKFLIKFRRIKSHSDIL